MRYFPLYTLTHLGAFAAGIALGIYILPVLTAAPPPPETEIASAMQGEMLTAEFRRDLKGSDFFHWGEGSVSVTAKAIVHRGKLAPGPDYRLYLVPGNPEDGAEFRALKDKSVQIAEIRGFSGFIAPVPANVDVKAYSSVVIWCERFGQFISAARYR